MPNALNGLKVAILVTDGFEQSELVKPREALEQAGATAHVIAPKPGEVQGFKHHDRGDKVKVDLAFDQANPDDYDAVLLPGGALNADALRIHKPAQEFVKKFDSQGKPIAVICHGPWLLASAGVLKGRKITSYHTVQDDLRNAGATWVDQEVVRDRNLVSSRKPDDIPAFNKEMIQLFSERRNGQATRTHAPGP